MATEKTDNLSTVTVASPAAPTVVKGTPISSDTVVKMLNILDELVEHTHLLYDDYGTACQCQCQCDCTCTRGGI